MMKLPEFYISARKQVAIVSPRDFYPQSTAENLMLMRAIAKQLDLGALNIRFDLSNWISDPEANLEVKSRCLMDVIVEFRSLGIGVAVTGFSPSKGSLLTAIFRDPLAESQQNSTNYLISRIPELQKYSIAKDMKAVILWGQDLKNFSEQQSSPGINLLANMLIRESSSNHWDVVEALIQQLLQETEEKLSGAIAK